MISRKWSRSSSLEVGVDRERSFLRKEEVVRNRDQLPVCWVMNPPELTWAFRSLKSSLRGFFFRAHP